MRWITGLLKFVGYLLAAGVGILVVSVVGFITAAISFGLFWGIIGIAVVAIGWSAIREHAKPPQGSIDPPRKPG